MVITNEEVLAIVRVIGGEQAAQIAQKLLKKPGLSDEEVAAALEIDVKQVRKILHQLSELSLVTYEQTFDKKENKRVFRWRLQPEQVIGVAKSQIQRILERLRLIREQITSSQFYWCGNERCRKYTFEESFDKFFTCPSCGGQLNYHDHSELRDAIEKKIRELEEILK
ncbi:MAG: hypothetical protein NZ920_00260 [Aigarchaeota archaeon]|nr:hypothetical protein [Aigarchaeota archaeon]